MTYEEKGPMPGGGWLTALLLVAAVLLIGFWPGDSKPIPAAVTTTSSSTTTLAHEYVSLGGRGLTTGCVNGDRVYMGHEWGQVIDNDPTCPQGSAR